MSQLMSKCDLANYTSYNQLLCHRQSQARIFLAVHVADKMCHANYEEQHPERLTYTAVGSAKYGQLIAK